MVAAAMHPTSQSAQSAPRAQGETSPQVCVLSMLPPADKHNAAKSADCGRRVDAQGPAQPSAPALEKGAPTGETVRGERAGL